MRRRAGRRPQPLRQAEEHGERRRTTSPWSPTARTHSFRFVVLADASHGRAGLSAGRQGTRAVAAVAPQHAAGRADRPRRSLPPPAPSPRGGRRRAAAGRADRSSNSSYSIAEGEGSDDIVPTLVFDDGRFTYLRFPGNREIPAVFHVLGDGSETLVNTRMEDDLLVVDRVSRRLMLRAGSAVVGIWNDAFDLRRRRRRSHGTTVARRRSACSRPLRPPLRHRRGVSPMNGARRSGRLRASPPAGQRRAVAPLARRSPASRTSHAARAADVEERTARGGAARPLAGRRLGDVDPALRRPAARRPTTRAPSAPATARRPPAAEPRGSTSARPSPARLPPSAEPAPASRRSSATADELPSRSACAARAAPTPASDRQPAVPPEDAPVVLVVGRPPPRPARAARRPGASAPAQPRHRQRVDTDPLAETRRNLESLPAPTAGLLDTLTRRSDDQRRRAAARRPHCGRARCRATGAPRRGAAAAGGLFGGQLQGSATPRVTATMLGDRSLTLPKGTAFTCALKTKVVSAASGLRRLPGAAQRLQRRRPGAAGRARLAPRRRVPDRLGQARHACAFRCSGRASARPTA